MHILLFRISKPFGVIYITILGSLIRDPWVALVLGSGGSFLTYILLLIKEKLKPSRYVFDTKNLIPVLLINSIVASALAVPLVLLAYSDRGYEKQNDIVYEKVNHMIYTGISLGIGFGFGLLAGLLKCIISQSPVLRDITFFTPAFRIIKGSFQEYQDQKK